MSNKKSHLDKISIPNYSLGEEIFNSVSHGIGALLSIAALVLMVVKAHGGLSETAVSLFGATMIILYTISCIYHALGKSLSGKKVLRIIDHCNVYALVLGTYIPLSLIAVSGATGWALFGVVCAVTITGITFSAINIEKFKIIEVICHLISGWSSLFFINRLTLSMGKMGVFYFILGGIMYTLGCILYAFGHKKRYMHSIFHIFCLFGTFFHFISIYFYAI